MDEREPTRAHRARQRGTSLPHSPEQDPARKRGVRHAPLDHATPGLQHKAALRPKGVSGDLTQPQPDGKDVQLLDMLRRLQMLEELEHTNLLRLVCMYVCMYVTQGMVCVGVQAFTHCSTAHQPLSQLGTIMGCL